MVRNRPKLYDFLRDHDYVNHDRIKTIDFHRAMDRAGFELTPREIEVLTCWWDDNLTFMLIINNYFFW